MVTHNTRGKRCEVRPAYWFLVNRGEWMAAEIKVDLRSAQCLDHDRSGSCMTALCAHDTRAGTEGAGDEAPFTAPRGMILRMSRPTSFPVARDARRGPRYNGHAALPVLAGT